MTRSAYTILVTDPEQRASLAAVRSLGRAGHKVLTLGERKGLAGRSRYVAQHIPFSPSPERGAGPQLVECVARTAQDNDVHVILPVTDAACRILLPAWKEVKAPLAAPEWSAYERASDKALLMRTAPEVGIQVPVQLRLESRDQIEKLGAIEFEQSVVKPARSVVIQNGTALRLGVKYATNSTTLRKAVDSYPEAAYPLLVQERCGGEGIGVFLLRDAGRTLMCAGHRRLREKPPSGGVSTYRESEIPDPPLLRNCEALLDRLAYSGPAMVEFKRDPTSGRTVLMEINARLWGSVQLAILAGADFPRALVAWRMGDAIESWSFRDGVRCAWELGELDHILSLLRGSPESLNLPENAVAGVRGAYRALRNRRFSDRAEVFSWSDPIPAISEAVDWMRNLSGRKSL